MAFAANAFDDNTFDVCPEVVVAAGSGGKGFSGILDRREIYPIGEPPKRRRERPRFVEAAARIGAVLVRKATPSARMGLEMGDDVTDITVAAAMMGASIADFDDTS